MGDLIKAISSIFEHLTFKRVLLFSILSGFILTGFIVYQQSATIINNILVHQKYKELKSLSPESQQMVTTFMKKHTEVVYITVLTYIFEKNTRLPIYRAFNSDELKKIVYDRLNGGDGALPIFIDGDTPNNNQMISMITGEYICSPYDGGGLARVWPDLVNKIHTSCRVPIPPVFGNGIRGYIVVHINQKITNYENEVLKLDLLILAKTIHELS